MMDALVHRGPDDSGFALAAGVARGFRRLSILDLSPTGHQPMVSSNADVAIIFNGEIYNLVELRGELQARGHHFVSTGDTEVLLRAYPEWGADCLPRLNGMLAFLVHDRRTGVVFGSRDRWGIKPIFIWRRRDVTLISPEIKATSSGRLLTLSIDQS